MKRVIHAASQIIENGFDAKLANKPITPAEARRTKEFNDMLYEKLSLEGDWELYYEEEATDEPPVLVYEMEVPGRRTTELYIYKSSLVYAQGWDENERRVKKGKKVPGTIFYSVSDDGDAIDESVIGYKTLDDARHAAMIYWKDVMEVYNR